MTPSLVEWRGPASAPPLLLLHGFMGLPADWDAFAARLGGWRLGFVRLRAMPPALLAARLRAACGHQPAALAGYSMGGRLAIRLAVRHPEWFPRLIALSATAGLRGRSERRARRQADALLAARLQAMRDGAQLAAFFLREWRAAPLFRGQKQPDPLLERQKAAARAGLDPADLARQLRVWGQGALPPSWRLLPRYPGRALLLAGGCDAQYSHIAKRMAALFPSAETRILPGAAHDLLLDAPAEAAAATHAFLLRSRW